MSPSLSKQLGKALLAFSLILTMLALTGLPAFGSTTVQLHGPHVGTQSDDADDDIHYEEDRGGISSGVVWHFIVNQLDEVQSTDTAVLTATFSSAGTLVDVGEHKGGQSGGTYHFFVATPTHDTLTGASAFLSGDHPSAKLVLSHLCGAPILPQLVADPAVSKSGPGDEQTLEHGGGRRELHLHADLLQRG